MNQVEKQHTRRAANIHIYLIFQGQKKSSGIYYAQQDMCRPSFVALKSLKREDLSGISKVVKLFSFVFIFLMQQY